MGKRMFNGRIRWKRQWGGADRIVWVSVPRLDLAWRGDQVEGYYLPPGAARHHRFGRWLEQHAATAKAHMPHVGLWDGTLSFTDGRHRFAWCRDHGVLRMPVTVEGRKQVALFHRLFGTRGRVCIVPKNGM